MVMKDEEMGATEFFDYEDIEKLLKISKDVVGHNIDQVWM